jgi:hypothetical protein
MTALIIAALGAKAFYLLYLWLASAWLSGELSRRKGYGEKWGLGTGLLLSAIGVIVWLLVPARPDSIWKQRGFRRAKAEKVDPGAAA